MIFPGSCIASVLALDPLYLGLAGRAASGGALVPEPSRATRITPESMDIFHVFFNFFIFSPNFFKVGSDTNERTDKQINERTNIRF